LLGRASGRGGLAGDIAGATIGAALAGVAAVRRGKALHPAGVVYGARVSVDGAAYAPRARLLCERGEHEAVVRFSRSIGLPRPLPDLLGMSIRVPDAYGLGRHQDLLLVSSADLPVLHHIFLPAGDVWQRPYSSSLPYRTNGERFLVGALAHPDSPRPDGSDEFARLDAAAATGRLRFQLAVASLGGRFRPVADLRIGTRLPDDLDALRFNPWNTGADLEPAGWLNRARLHAYELSQRAWRRTQSCGAERQSTAETELARLAGGFAQRSVGSRTSMEAERPGDPIRPDESLAEEDQAQSEEVGTGEDLCPRCNGRGEVDGEECSGCGGTGKVITGIGGG
jgi:hypothetical protein